MSYNYNLVLHVDSDDPKILRLAFHNAANYKAALPGEQFQMALIANGPAVKLFVKKRPKLAERGRELAAMGLEIFLCEKAITGNHINPAELWDECRIVPAGMVALVQLQRQGFSYIKP